MNEKYSLLNTTILTEYDGIKEAVSLDFSTLYLWDSYQKECEYWKILDTSDNKELLQKYLNGKIGLLTLYNACPVLTGKLNYNDPFFCIVIEKNLFIPTPPKI